MQLIGKARPVCSAALLLLLTIMAHPRAVTAAEPVETAGSVLAVLIPSVAYGATFHLDDKDGRNQFYKSFFSNVAVTWTLKQTISKTRPNGEDDESFPSGHSSVAFQGAAFIHKRYGWKYAAPAYIGSTFVAWSRVKSDNHYVVDVVSGAAIGIVSAMIFTRPYKGFVVTPVAYGDFYGVGITKKF